MTPVYVPEIHRLLLDSDHYGEPMTEHLGLILHVAQANGPLHDYFASTVAPKRKSATWWIGKGGRIEQYVPKSRAAWAQGNGNATYNSAETEGYDHEELTLLQCAGLAHLLRLGHDRFHWPFKQAHKPGERGFGTHSMGGVMWGDHPCPGLLRAGERSTIIRMAQGDNVEPLGHVLYDEVRFFKKSHGLPHTAVIGPRVRALLSL